MGVDILSPERVDVWLLFDGYLMNQWLNLKEWMFDYYSMDS